MRTRLDRDAAAGGLIAALVLAPLALPWARGLVHFWGDLGYLHRPWHAYDAQLLQAGRLPLWNPYLYFGMPQAAAMQDGLFYPGTVLFSVFSFPAAAEAFAALHVALAGWLTFLWLRAARLAPAGSLLGACVVALGGVFLQNRQFLNHLSTLAFLPAILLFFSRPAPLAAALALGFLAGYPPFLLGAAAGAWALAWALAPRRHEAFAAARRVWPAASLAAAGAAACLLLPAAELWRVSRRAAPVALDEALSRHLSPAELWGWVSPALARGAFDPSRLWWKCCYVGLAATAAAVWGLTRLPARRRWALAGLLCAALGLTLGPETAASRAAWTLLPPLRFVRYPGNLTYLALWPLALAAAAGITRRTRWLVAAAVLELSFYGWNALPVAPASVYGERGPLVERLQREAGEARYLLSPRALTRESGRGAADWEERLYGLSNAPYRLRAASNLGEPLAPRSNYAVMDALLSARSAGEAAALFPWTGVRFLLTPEPLSGASGLSAEPPALWAISRWNGPSSPAYFFAEADGPPATLSPSPAAGAPLAFERPREDRFAVSGASSVPGWVYLSEPLYPGWKAELEDASGVRSIRPEPAMTAFQKAAVPAGRWRLTFRYDPGSWRLGLTLTLATLALLGARALEHRWTF